MTRKLHVATTRLINRIYAGTVNKTGDSFNADKQDVTDSATLAVADYIAATGQPLIVSRYGVPCYEITVKAVSGS